MAGPLGQMLRCHVTAGEGTDMPERSAARGGVDIDLLQGGPKVRTPSPPAGSLSRTCSAGRSPPARRRTGGAAFRCRADAPGDGQRAGRIQTAPRHVATENLDPDTPITAPTNRITNTNLASSRRVGSATPEELRFASCLGIWPPIAGADHLGVHLEVRGAGAEGRLGDRPRPRKPSGAPGGDRERLFRGDHPPVESVSAMTWNTAIPS